MNFGYSHVRRKGCTLIAESTSDFPSGTKNSLGDCHAPLRPAWGMWLGRSSRSGISATFGWPKRPRLPERGEVPRYFSSFSPHPRSPFFDGKGRFTGAETGPAGNWDFPGTGKKSYNPLPERDLSCRVPGKPCHAGKRSGSRLLPRQKRTTKTRLPVPLFQPGFEVLVTPFFYFAGDSRDGHPRTVPRDPRDGRPPCHYALNQGT